MLLNTALLSYTLSIMANLSYAALELDEDNEIIYQNQIACAKQMKAPMFASRKCWNCGMSLKNILTINRTLEQAQLYAASNLLTGCNNCGRTWCD